MFGLEVIVELCIFDGDGRLSAEHADGFDAVGGEGAAEAVMFKVEGRAEILSAGEGEDQSGAYLSCGS